MRVSYRWLSELVDLSGITPQKLAEILTSRGLEVEAIEDQAQGFDKVVSAKLIERGPHPQADRLSLCKVSFAADGASDPIEIVCGAQNMKSGDTVALAQIGAHLPNGLKIALSKIRGSVSNGMLCSESELGLAKESEGIIILPPSTPIGKPLAEILGRSDTILELKLTANRSDCLSHRGLAREVGSALGRKPKQPEIKLAAPLSWTGSPIAIELRAGDDAPQFYGISIDGVKIGPSPEWLVKRLEAVGSRAINNVVDATNLVMLELGHPMHAYDATKVEGGKIGVRHAKQGEVVPLLDATEAKLEGGELVIVSGGDGADRAIGLAGVMGGGNSEVQDSTTKLFLECAEFAPGLIRRASSRHQKKTEASHRFERGVDPQGLVPAISRLASLILELAGGQVVGSVMSQTREPRASKPVLFAPGFIQSFLGMNVSSDRALEILQGLDCSVVQKSREEWVVTPPSYRLDLNRREDLAEEIARTVGYNEIPATIPPLSGLPRIRKVGADSAKLDAVGEPAAAFRQIERAKDLLVQAGLSETLNYSFTSKSWLARFGFESSAVLINPLTEEHEALVPSLLPGLVRNSLDNWNHHFGSEPLAIRLFELRPTFSAPGPIVSEGEMKTNAEERWKLAFALSGPRFRGGLSNQLGEVDFYDLKAVVDGLLEGLGARGVRLQPLSASRTGGHPLFHPGQSVEVLAGKDVAGYFGLLHPAKAMELKTRAPLWIGELDWSMIAKLSPAAGEPRAYHAWPQYPAIERDFALLVRDDVTTDKITQVAVKAGRPLAKVAKVFDIYRGSQVAEGMTSVAVRVIFYDESRSLQETEAEAATSQILSAWKKELGIELRG